MLAATVAVGAGCTALSAAPMQLSIFCVRQVNDIFQWAADISGFSICHGANLGHHEACAILVCFEGFLILLSVLCGFLELRLAVLAWVICEDEDAQQVGSLPRLALPLIFIFTPEWAPDVNIPRPTGLDACFVEH